MKKFCLLVFSFFIVCLTEIANAQIVIVTNPKSPITSLSREQASALFLGKSFNLPGAGIALLLDQPESNPVRDQFYIKLTGKSVIQVKGVWMRLVFSGKGVPPTEVANSVEVKKAVSKSPDALGYIEKTEVDSSVKVLFVIE